MLKEAKNIYLTGIGGIGVSALAQILKKSGKAVAGFDLQPSKITEKLEREGIEVTAGARTNNLPEGVDLLVYSAAVPESDAARRAAKNLGIPQMSYPEALGELASEYETVIAVAGTNGKTTTTAMIAIILEQAGLNPTAVVGSEVMAWRSNARVGEKKYLVLEADEYRRAFLNYRPNIAVITNIEADHLDYFRDLADVRSAFAEFIQQIKNDGVLVCNPDDLSFLTIPDKLEVRNVSNERFNLKLPGEFNQENAQMAATVAKTLGVPGEQIKESLEGFSGTWRRFQLVGTMDKTRIISDYAHHPSALAATLRAAGETYGAGKILAVFQPHQHNRTRMLFRDFVRVICQSAIDDFLLAEIFEVTGREEAKDQDISAKDLTTEIEKCGKRVEYAKDLRDCEEQIRSRFADYSVILIMGAGDIYKVADRLAAKT